MKFSIREKVLLVLLILISIGFLEFQFLVRPSIDRYNNLLEQDTRLEQEIKEIEMVISVAETLIERKDSIINQITDYQENFIGNLNPSVLFYNVYGLFKQNDFNPSNYSISSVITSNPVVIVNEPYEIDYDIKRIVNEYKDLRSNSNENEEQEELTIVTDIELNEYFVVGRASYSQIINLLDDIQLKEKSVLVKNISLRTLEQELYFEILLQYYGIEKLSEGSDEYNTWTRPEFVSQFDSPFLEIDEASIVDDIIIEEDTGEEVIDDNE